MIWLILSLSIYPLGWLALGKLMSKNERKVIEWEEKGFGSKYAMDIEKIKDWPLALWLGGYPIALGILLGFVARDLERDYGFVICCAAVAFFAGHLFLGQEMSYGVAAREAIEAEKRKAKTKQPPIITL